MEISEDYGQQSFKRRRFNENSDPAHQNTPHHANPFAMHAKSPPNGSALKRSRNDFHAFGGVQQDLNVVVQQQSQEIASLKQEKATLENTAHELRVENERVVNENKILKKAVTIQQERQNHAASELQAANNYKVEAEDRMKKLEQMILTLRYHLQAQQSHPGNDFMGTRPPDVF
jgi:hypothetical protein